MVLRGYVNSVSYTMGSKPFLSQYFKLAVLDPVIQANGRLTFEDDLRSGGLLLHSVSRQDGHSGGTQGWLGVERCYFCWQDTSRSAK